MGDFRGIFIEKNGGFDDWMGDDPPQIPHEKSKKWGGLAKIAGDGGPPKSPIPRGKCLA